MGSLIRCALALAACLVAGVGGAQERLKLPIEGSTGPIEIQADRLSGSQADRRVQAQGGVTATWAGYRLNAKKVSYDHETGIVTAEEAVTLKDEAGNVLHCRRLTAHVVTQEGEVEDGELFVAREGYRVWGKHFQRTGPNSYVAEKGGFSACDGTWPSWEVHADRLEVELEGYLVGRGAAFWVESVPVAYTPYVLFPVMRERQSGFLIPKLGYSTRDGALLLARYYWAFADNADLVARLEYRSRRGWTEAGELRYVLAEGHSGTAEVSHLYDRRDESHRYTVKADHDSRFGEDSRVRLHVDYLGDTNFLKDFGDTIDERGVERLKSYLLGTHSLDSGTAFGFAEYIEALDQSQSGVLQTLPSVGILGKETPLWGRLSYSPDTRLTRFWRAEGERGERWELDPSLALDREVGPIGLAARAGYREQLYWVEDQSISRGAILTECGATTMLSRGFGDLVHTIEPKVSFQWEEAGRGGRTPRFDERDVFENRADLVLRVDSRVLRRPDLGAVAGMELEGRLDLGVARKEGWGVKALRPWRGELWFTPTERLGLRAEGEYDPSVRDPWLRWLLSGQAANRRGDKLFAAYDYLKGSASYLDGGVSVAVTRELSLEYRHRHSYRDGRTLEEGVGLRLEHPCWELLTTFSRNYKADEDRYESRYLLALQLKGLGKIGTLRGIVP